MFFVELSDERLTWQRWPLQQEHNARTVPCAVLQVVRRRHRCRRAGSMAAPMKTAATSKGWASW
jgi:hypothetical protein